MGIKERIERLLDEKDIKKIDIINLSGIKRSTFYSLFNKDINENNVSIDTLSKVAKVLGVSLDYLVYGNCNEKNCDNMEEQLLIKFKNLNNESKEKVLEYIALLSLSEQKMK